MQKNNVNQSCVSIEISKKIYCSWAYLFKGNRYGLKLILKRKSFVLTKIWILFFAETSSPSETEIDSNEGRVVVAALDGLVGVVLVLESHEAVIVSVIWNNKFNSKSGLQHKRRLLWSSLSLAKCMYGQILTSHLYCHLKWRLFLKI